MKVYSQLLNTLQGQETCYTYPFAITPPDLGYWHNEGLTAFTVGVADIACMITDQQRIGL